MYIRFKENKLYHRKIMTLKRTIIYSSLLGAIVGPFAAIVYIKTESFTTVLLGAIALGIVCGLFGVLLRKYRG